MALMKFSQSSLLKAANEEDNAGVCWALSVKWLNLSLSGKSDEQAKRVAALTQWMPEAIVAQKRYAGTHHSTEVPSEFTNPGVIKALAMLRLVGEEVGGITFDRSVKEEVLLTMPPAPTSIPSLRVCARPARVIS